MQLFSGQGLCTIRLFLLNMSKRQTNAGSRSIAVGRYLPDMPKLGMAKVKVRT